MLPLCLLVLDKQNDINVPIQDAERVNDKNGTSFACVDELSKKCIIALDSYYKGEDIESHIEYLGLLLGGHLSQTFSQMSIQGVQASLLLLLSRYARLIMPSDLNLLMRLLPYYSNLLCSDSNRFVGGIAIVELLQAQNRSPCQLTHDLNTKISDFLKGSELPVHSKKEEWLSIIQTIKHSTHHDPQILHKVVVCALLEWKENSAPSTGDTARMLRAFAWIAHDLTCSDPDSDFVNKAIKNIYDDFCACSIDADYNSALYLHVFGPEEVLRKVQSGHSAVLYLKYAKSILLGHAPVTFNDFTPKEQQAFLLLFLHSEYDLFLYALPYCLKHVDSVFTVTFIGARAVSASEFRAAVIKKIGEFLSGNCPQVTENTGFKRFLNSCFTSTDLELFARALGLWFCVTKPEPIQMAKNIDFFIKASLQAKHKVKQYQDQVSQLIELLLVHTNASEYCLEVLYRLFSKDASSLMDWLVTFQKGPLLPAINDIVASNTFSTYRRCLVYKKWFTPETPIYCLVDAVQELTILRTQEIKILADKLVDRLVVDPQNETLTELFYRMNTQSFDYRVRNAILEYLLSKNRPECIFCATQMTYALTLSSVIDILNKTMGCPFENVKELTFLQESIRRLTQVLWIKNLPSDTFERQLEHKFMSAAIHCTLSEEFSEESIANTVKERLSVMTVKGKKGVLQSLFRTQFKAYYRKRYNITLHKDEILADIVKKHATLLSGDDDLDCSTDVIEHDEELCQVDVLAHELEELQIDAIEDKDPKTKDCLIDDKLAFENRSMNN